MNNEKEVKMFIGIIGEINDRLDELKTFIVDNHMEYNPDDINWGHLGTASHYLKNLTELTDLAYGRGEYAE